MANDGNKAAGVALLGGAAALLFGLLGTKSKHAAPTKLSGPPPVRKSCNCGR
jgi:hypothetical protein